ncbi:MAG TPA: hypothetical protein VGY32_12245 [Solirubrobacteraceae bacterium]|nr:hypothetical protein [Solirubrobacteraceae bacterium]
MSRRSRIVPAAVAVAAFLCALPTAALASTTESTSMMDDDQLIYVSQSHMARTLQQMSSLGADTVKVSVVWQLIAPSPSSTHRPKFDATDPAAYPQGAWDRYDALVKASHRLGMKVYFLVIGPAPKWAISNGVRNSRQGPDLGLAPNVGDYQNFVEAVGRRYSGAWPDPSAPQSSSSSTPSVAVQGVTVPVTVTQRSSTPPTMIPRVNDWGIWNEPNERSWMNPWYRQVGRRRVYIQPQWYRGLVDAAWNGLSASSHSSDTIMIGETANRGTLTPTQFVRGLYCVGASLRPLTGSAASDIGCPTSGSPAQFANQHPGLFESAGWAHHPYAFDTPPNRPYSDRTYVAIYNLPSFERLLAGIFVTYGLHPTGGVPLYLTEWGEKSNPPNPYVKTTTAQQAEWINQGEYMTWRMPYVRALNQFELVDSPPRAEEPKGSVLYWSSFQTGLEFRNSGVKPAYQAFQIPIWLPSARHGRSVAVWGQLRPADHSTSQVGVIEFRARGSGRWSKLANVQTSSPEGFIYNHVAIPSAGDVRLGWLNPSGSVVYSRTVSVS